MNTAKEQARDRLMKALEEYSALCPPVPASSGPIVIEPKKFWAPRSTFERGVNAMLNCWTAPRGDQVPVLVVPLRPQDFEHYLITASVRGSVAGKLKAIGIEPVK